MPFCNLWNTIYCMYWKAHFKIVRAECQIGCLEERGINALASAWNSIAEFDIFLPPLSRGSWSNPASVFNCYEWREGISPLRSAFRTNSPTTGLQTDSIMLCAIPHGGIRGASISLILYSQWNIIKSCSELASKYIRCHPKTINLISLL